MAGKNTAKSAQNKDIPRPKRKKRTNAEKLAALATKSNAQLLDIVRNGSLKAAAAKVALVARGITQFAQPVKEG